MTVQVNGVGVAFDYRDEQISPDPIPTDSSEIVISYEQFGDPLLEYPLLLEDDIAIAARDKQSGESISYEQTEKSVIFKREDFAVGREIEFLQDYKKKTNFNFRLPHEPIPGSIKISESGEKCEPNQIKVWENRWVSVNCDLNKERIVQVSYDYETDIKSEFIMSDLGDIENTIWQVKVAGEVYTDFVREGNTVKIAEKLPAHTEIVISVEWPND